MRSKMNRADRAKQFMPFAALKGYDEAIAALNMAHEPRITLGEDAAQELDAQLRALSPGARAAVRYYTGRVYETVIGRVQALDPESRLLYIAGLCIRFDDIAGIDIE